MATLGWQMKNRSAHLMSSVMALLLITVFAEDAGAQETCTVESPCPADSGSCYAPTDINCGPPRCVEMALACTEDSDCGLGQVCGDVALEVSHFTGYPGQCTARACAENDDCPTDFECMGGLCERASCESNSDCDGVCVNHACHEEPGYCTNPHPSPPPEPSDSEIPIVIED